jgi:hypothetical protein
MDVDEILYDCEVLAYGRGAYLFMIPDYYDAVS